MATIENFISMRDGVSPILERIAQTGRNAATRMEQLGGVAERAGNRATEASSKLSSMADIFKGSFLADIAMRGVEQVKQAIGSLMGTAEQYAGIQARLKMIGGSAQNAAYLNEQIYQSAQKARGGYLEMAEAVSQISMSAHDAFPDPREAVDFMEGIQKLFTIGGASKENQKFAMLQLTQGLASGQLQGDEFRSIAENAPIIENMIAKTMGVSRGELKKLASQGQVTAEIVKKSILDNMDEINAQFMQMPMRWGGLTSLAANSVIHSFQPVFNRISGLANSPGIKKFFTLIVELASATAPFFYNLVGVAEWAINTVVGGFGAGIEFLKNNMWLVHAALGAAAIAMLFFGMRSAVTAAQIGAAAIATGIKTVADWAETGAIIALTFAQDGLNAALAMCPLTWIIGLIVLLITVFYLAVAAVNYFAGTSISATGLIFGAFGLLYAHIWNGIAFTWNMFVAFANFLANVFRDPLGATYNLFVDIWNGVVDYVREAVNGIIAMINKIPGIDKVIGKEPLQPISADAFKADRKEIAGGEVVVAHKMEYKNYGDTAGGFYDAGATLQNKVTNMFTFPGDVGKNNAPGQFDKSKVDPSSLKDNQNKELTDAAKQTAKNTGKIADSIDMSDDDIRELRDVATQQAVSQWQEKNVVIHVTNNNTVNNQMDVDGINNDLVDGLRKAFNELEGGVE